jgi:hypothetical protein
MIGTEILIKNIISEILFNNVICESLQNFNIVSYFYNKLFESGLLHGEPISVPELRKLLHTKIVEFEFIKLNGEIRPATGTTVMEKIPGKDHPKGIRPSSKKVATFFDLKKQAWRSVSMRSKEIVLTKETLKKAIVAVRDKQEKKPNEIIIAKKEEEPKKQEIVKKEQPKKEEPTVLKPIEVKSKEEPTVLKPIEVKSKEELAKDKEEAIKTAKNFPARY